MAERWYRLTQLPDLTLNKYAALEEKGVGGVLEKHVAFLRQLNRKGIVSDLSFHLFYLYYVPEDKSKDKPGHRLQIYFLIRGKETALETVPALIKASPLADYYPLESEIKSKSGKKPCSMETVLKTDGFDLPSFNTAAFLTKSETLLPSATGDGENYYLIREWETNEDGRLYNMCNMMDALKHTVLYRVDLYPVEKSIALREALRRPMGILRKRQDAGSGSAKDYEGKDVLKSYEDLIEMFDTSPHFVANVMVFANGREDAVSVLDAAGAESLLKGKYNISTFSSAFTPLSFLDGKAEEMENLREQMVLRKGRPGLIVCREDTVGINLNYLPTLFSLEEIAPFFRFPALYDGETIQLAKETAPAPVEEEDPLYLGKDRNGYDVLFPLSLFPKHAFIAGVPGSGKTNTMHHITSTLWKKHDIPFLVLEPAKQEYRALANDPGMKDMYLFSPNADMSFPLHINPFEMPKGIMVAEHIRRLCSVFEGAFPLDPPMPFLLDTAIEAVYREKGWIPEHVYTGNERSDDGKTKRPLPTMSMLYRRLEEELNSTRYSDEVRGNLESALKVRIGSLLRREMGEVFDVPVSTFEPEKWLDVPAVIELESMGTGPANFLTLMLCALIRETLKVNPVYTKGKVRHVIFIEEAHNLIGPESEEQTGAEADPKQAATAFIVKMLAEVRALKEGIVIADQLPSVMAPEVLKNTGLKIGLKITSADDRSLLGSTMAASAMQLEQMSTFRIGEALIFYEKLQRPFIMRVKEWWGELEDAAKEEMKTSKRDADLRRHLADNAAYRDANLKSIDIILKKYIDLVNEKLDSVEYLTRPMDQLAKMTRGILQMTQTLVDNRAGKIHLTEEKRREKQQSLADLQEKRAYMLKDKTNIESYIKAYQSLLDWLFALERLKNGRWTRFPAPAIWLVKATFLQAGICEQAIRMNKYLTQGLPELPEVQALEKRSEEMLALSKTISEDLSAQADLVRQLTQNS